MVEFLGEQVDTASMKDGQIVPKRMFWFWIEDTLTTRPSSILLNEELPKFKSVHPVFDDKYVTDYSLDMIEGDERKGKFEVTVKYGELSDSKSSLTSANLKPWEKPAYNIGFGTNSIVVPQEYAYDEDDKQFEPSIPVQHPATREVLISDTIENHGIISFSYNVRKFRYSWKREYEDTVNKEAVKMLGSSFPAKTLLLRALAASQKTYVDSNGSETEYWQVNVEIEDFHKEWSKKLALRGYTALFEDKVKNIQLKNGVFGDHDQTDTSLNITTPRFVNKSGIVLDMGNTVYDEYYDEFNDKFFKNWKSIDLPGG